MTRFVVFEPEAAAEKSADAVFLRDRFSWFALVLPAVWLLRHGLVLAAVLALAATFALAALGRLEGFGVTGVLLPLLLGLAVALEGPSLRAARYRRRGYREVAAVHAAGRREAELLYYADEAIRVAPPARPSGGDNLLMPAGGTSALRRGAAGWRSGHGLFGRPGHGLFGRPGHGLFGRPGER